MDSACEGRVLLLDDERLVRFTISAWLKASHFEVTAVATLEEALEALKTRNYDAILSDVMMGVIDGFMFRDSVRGFNAKIPFIFLTALVNSPTNKLLEKVAADPYSYYAAKNSRRDYILGRLRQVITAYRAECEAESLRGRIEADLNIAARVQHALLPPYTQYSDGIFYSGFWRPHNIVSGDLFVWFPLHETAAIAVFGDIAGHGTPAALAMAAVIAHIKSLEHSELVRTCRPELLAHEIDEYIRTNLRDISYMAGTILFVDMGSHVVRYLNAGGIDPICFQRCDGTRVELNPENRGAIPMGLMDGTAYTAEDVVETCFPDDAVLCMYTDGFMDLTTDAAGESRMPRDMFNEILGEFFRSSSGSSDIGSIPYRFSSMLKDMGYVHAQDDEMFCVIGAPFASEMRFVSTVPMRSGDDINDVIDRAAHWAAARGFTDGFLARLELLLVEHLENVHKHGLSASGRLREVVVLEMRPVGKDLEIIAWDRGSPYDGDLSESAPHPDVKLDEQNESLATSGRGLAIVRKICRSVSYERFDILNKFTFILGESES